MTMMYVDTTSYSTIYLEDSTNANNPTPLTPTSSFTTSKLESSQNLISSLLLCYWDNVLGPRIQHSWQVASQEILDNPTAHTLCRKSMSSEICRDPSDSSIDYKFYSFPDKQMLLLALIFSTMSSSLEVNALLVIMPQGQYMQYLQKYELILCWLKRLISKFKVYVTKNAIHNALNMFSSDLKVFFGMMATLHESGIPNIVQVKNTLFSTDNSYDKDFLVKAITSHLITFGRSVVVGKDIQSINMMISTLSLFNTEAERVCSHYVTPDSRNIHPYHHDVWIQGLIKGPVNVLSTLTTEMLCSRYPTTIIDLQHQEIFHSLSSPEHFIRQHRTLVDELTALFTNDAEKVSFPKGMFYSFEYSGSIVSTLLSEMEMLPEDDDIIRSYIRHFQLALHRHAVALIKYLQCDGFFRYNTTRINIKKIKQDMNLNIDGNFRVVLATAEKIHPGLYSTVFRDRMDTESLISDGL